MKLLPIEPLGEPYAATLTDDSPLWHVAIVQPNQERVAASHLVGRRFACYLPEFERLVPASRGRAAHIVRRPLIPGYIFLYVWNVREHAGRIRACPGIVDLLYDGEEPAVIPDALIDAIQLTETTFGFKKPKRRRWRKRKIQPEEEIIEVSAIKCYAAIGEGMKQLSDTERTSLLHKALGLDLQ